MAVSHINCFQGSRLFSKIAKLQGKAAKKSCRKTAKIPNPANEFVQTGFHVPANHSRFSGIP
jgi:hypothetical protein